MKVEILTLGEMVVDVVTNLSGMLTIANLDGDKNEFYFFQPALISPDTEEPVDGFWVAKSRIANSDKEVVELPVEVLTTKVKDKATGFEGTAINLYYYMNGCVHLEVKPQGLVAKTGQPIKARDFDIRRLSGKFLIEKSKEELKKDRVENPGPEALVRRMDM